MQRVKLTSMFKDISQPTLKLLYCARYPLFGFLAIVLGVLVGRGLASPKSYLDVVTYLVFGGWVILSLMDPPTGLLAVILVHPFIETSIKLDLGKGIPDFSITRFGVAFLLTLLLARAAVRLRPLVAPGRIEGAMLAALVGMIAAVDASVEPTGALQRILTLYLVPYLFFFLAKNLIQNRSHLDRLLIALAIIGAYSGLYATYEQLTGNILFTNRDLSRRILYYSENIRVLRGLYGEPAIFGRVFGMIIPVNFYLVLEAPTRRRRLFFLGTLSASLIGLFMAYNRTPWISTLLGFVVLQFAYPKFRRLFLALILVAGIFAFVGSDTVEDSTVVNERISSNSTLEGRTLRWETGVNMWKAKPIWGWGFDHYQYESGKYRPDGLTKNIKAVESAFIALLVATGVVGFVPWVAVMALLLYLSIRLYFRARAPDWPGFVEDKLFAVFWAVFITYVVGAWTVVINHPIISIIFFTVAGALIGTHQQLLSARSQGDRQTRHLGEANL